MNPSKIVLLISTENPSSRGLLSVSTKHLDSDAELRRFFGSKVVNSGKTSSKQHRNVAFRSQITHPPSTWIMQRTSQGLAMRQLEPSEARTKIGTQTGDKWWTVDHSSSYKEVQLQFLQTVQIGGQCSRLYIIVVYSISIY